MLISMTGFGRAVLASEESTVTVELKSVNHRFCDISIKMPRQLMPIEDKIKKVISESVQRGRVEAYITLKGEQLSAKTLKIDWSLLDQFKEAAAEMEKKFGLSGGIAAADLLKLQEAFEVSEEAVQTEERDRLILEAVRNACDLLYQMRKEEGRYLEEELLSRLSELEVQLSVIEERAPLVAEAYKERLFKRMAEFMDGAIEESRILAEAALFAEKADITEEISRMKSHMAQFRSACLEKGPAGRKLDFIVQELNREANTIGSKANDSRIASAAVNLKSLIEKLKEQVQNIE